MARVTNPFLSMDASGTIGKSLTACKWKGRNYMRKHFVPSNPNTPSQQSIRAVVSILSKYYAEVMPDEANRAPWEALGATQNNSGIAMFMKSGIDDYMAQHGTSEKPLSLVASDHGEPTLIAYVWTLVI